MGKSKNKKVFIWTKSISDLFVGTNIVGGIAIQLYFWSQEFRKNGWEVYTFTDSEPFEREGIFFCKARKWYKLEFLHDWVRLFGLCVRHRPYIILSRGASRSCFALAIVSRIFRIKYVLFGASDRDFEVGKELIIGEFNRRLYRRAVPKIRYVIVQNCYQQKKLKENYGKASLLIPNIWGEISVSDNAETEECDVLWIANLRKLKRAEWFLYAAQCLPKYRFVLAGGPTKDMSYYKKIQAFAKDIPNLTFCGQQTFEQTNKLVSATKLLVCTSEFEGFPNTFLQAWAQGKPVISTVDPNGTISECGLGCIIEDKEELLKRIPDLLEDKKLYQEKQEKIRSYFKSVHSADKRYEELKKFLDIYDEERTI